MVWIHCQKVVENLMAKTAVRLDLLSDCQWVKLGPICYHYAANFVMRDNRFQSVTVLTLHSVICHEFAAGTADVIVNFNWMKNAPMFKIVLVNSYF